MENHRKPIVILGPMVSESSWLASKTEHPIPQMIGAYRFVSGEVDGYPVVVGRTYIGMVNAAAATAAAIERFDPLCVIIQGTSGAHNPDLHRGDIVLGESLVHIGRYFTPHRDPGEGSHIPDWSFEGSQMILDGEEQFVSVLHSDPQIIEEAASVPYAHGKVIRGCIGAADIWNRELDMIAYLRDKLGTDCEEMEGFAVAQVCTQLNVPFADIRVISNSERYPEEPFDESYGKLCQEFCLDAVKRIIKSM